MFRAVAARGNYLGQGRAGVKLEAKEISRFTSKPGEQDWRAAQRLTRYFKYSRRVVIAYKLQEEHKKVETQGDAPG